VTSEVFHFLLLLFLGKLQYGRGPVSAIIASPSRLPSGLAFHRNECRSREEMVQGQRRRPHRGLICSLQIQLWLSPERPNSNLKGDTNRAASDKGEQEHEQRFSSSFDWRLSGISKPPSAWVDSCMMVHATLVFVVCERYGDISGESWIAQFTHYPISTDAGQRVAEGPRDPPIHGCLVVLSGLIKGVDAEGYDPPIMITISPIHLIQSKTVVWSKKKKSRPSRTVTQHSASGHNCLHLETISTCCNHKCRSMERIDGTKCDCTVGCTVSWPRGLTFAVDSPRIEFQNKFPWVAKAPK